MTDATRREAARQFVNKWKGKGNEDQDSQLYWIDFLSGIVGMENVTDRVNFEKKVIVDGHSKKIDVYIPETHTLIEQKSIGKALDRKITNSGDVELTAYEQAKRYNDNLPYDEKARWIVTSNFAEIWIYDMNTAVPEPVKMSLTELQTKFTTFDFMVNREQKKISQEMEISVRAGEFVGLIYDALLKQYLAPDSKESLRSLNMLCVRLVFCLYAEDAHIFGESGSMFHDYMDRFETKDMRKALMELFRVLDTPENMRDPYDTSGLSDFPYVNGGLFADENIEIPNFTDEIRNILLAKASEGFDWSMISPTIFGAVFESTLNPETRRSGGMHYTSIENIHKVIDPLFLDELTAELEKIKGIQVIKTRNARLLEYQEKLAALTWLDPACGSGNFLTETYISIRRLENDVIKTLKSGQISFVTEESNPIRVNISQFYGIEINDFAVTVAKTALWIAESQMMKETEDILLQELNFLPLKTNANIIEANALRLDWNDVISKDKLNYIMGNPPFVGYSMQSREQKEDILSIYVDEKGRPYKTAGKIDYVAGWYFKASVLMQGANIKTALVSTNSITQGEQVAGIWKPLFDRFKIHIDFAYRTFRWDSEASLKAHVHCVVIGFSCCENNDRRKLYSGENHTFADNINPYLVDAQNVFIDNRSKPLCDVPVLLNGGKPTEGGFLILSETEKEQLLKEEPQAKIFIRPYMMGKDFIDRKPRYCLWLVNANPSVLKSCKKVLERVEQVREYRLKSPKEATRKKAETPMLFDEVRECTSNYVAIPKVSSEKRRYVPMEYLSPDIIPGDKLFMLPDAELYDFGILTSNVHMAWMRAVCGRLKSDYSYSNTIVYNNFPWPSPTDEQKAQIEKCAQMILDARALYPDSSLADLYDPLTMPPELLKAHSANDRAVMLSYGFSVKDMSEADCVAALMQMYRDMTQST